MKIIALLASGLLLTGCVSAAVGAATLPFKVVGEGVDAVTTSQKEADRKRGKAIRKQEEREAKARRRQEREMRREERELRELEDEGRL